MARFFPTKIGGLAGGCNWPANMRSVCGLIETNLVFYAQDSIGNGCTQDCGAGDIKTAIRAYWSDGTVTYGKEGCPNSSDAYLSPSVYGYPKAYVTKAWLAGKWSSSVVVEWYAYRWNAAGGSFYLIYASWNGVSNTKYNVPVAGANLSQCAANGTLLCSCTCYDDGTYTFT